MSQTRRLTPEAHIPESESAPGKPLPQGIHRPNGEVYGSPWPLSGNFHLCVYDPDKRHFGIYLIDCFGNRELIWREPPIACLDPIPLRARTRPPIIPTATCQAKVDQLPNGDKSGTIARKARVPKPVRSVPGPPDSSLTSLPPITMSGSHPRKSAVPPSGSTAIATSTALTTISWPRAKEKTSHRPSGEIKNHNPMTIRISVILVALLTFADHQTMRTVSQVVILDAPAEGRH